MPLSVASPAFSAGERIPERHGVHHYHFALDVPELKLPNEACVKDVMAAAQPHVIAQAETVGTFQT